jgi:hypothetical protein
METESPSQGMVENANAPSGGDLSRNVIFVLVILTLLISVLGTWAVLSQVNAGQSAVPKPGSDHAQVSFVIQDPNAPVPPPAVSQTLGRVVLEIK